MNKNIIPALSQREVKEQIVDIEAWRNFAQRITKNPFVKEFLIQRDGQRCSWCKCVLQQNKIIHHTTYEHSCTYNVILKVSSPTEKFPGKTRIVPDCKGCKE